MLKAKVLRLFLRTGFAAAHITASVAALAQDSPEKQEMLRRLAEQANECLRTIATRAPPDLRVVEVQDYCKCMGIQETAISTIDEAGKNQMRPQLQQMCLGIIRKGQTSASAASPAEPAPAPPPPPPAAPTQQDSRRSEFFNACTSNSDFMPKAAPAEKSRVCECIVGRVQSTGRDMKPDDVSKARDACVSLARPMPASFGSWKMEHDADGLPRAVSLFERDKRLVAGTLERISAFCRSGSIAFQLAGNLGNRRVMQELDLGHSDEPAIRFRFNEVGIFDAASSKRLVENLMKGDRGFRKSLADHQARVKAGTALGTVGDKASYVITNPNPAPGRKSSEEMFGMNGSIEMIGFMREACAAR